MYPLKARIEYCKNNKAIIEQAVIINEENTLRLKLPVEINISGMNLNKEMEFNPDEIRIKLEIIEWTRGQNLLDSIELN